MCGHLWASRAVVAQLEGLCLQEQGLNEPILVSGTKNDFTGRRFGLLPRMASASSPGALGGGGGAAGGPFPAKPQRFSRQAFQTAVLFGAPQRECLSAQLSNNVISEGLVSLMKILKLAPFGLHLQIFLSLPVPLASTCRLWRWWWCRRWAFPCSNMHNISYPRYFKAYPECGALLY